jgi:23S rRNA pseudouridine1911/1915/1917 synthase
VSDDDDLILRIEPADVGQRLDKVVTEKLGNLGRRGVARLFLERRIRVGGRAAKKGDRARENDVVRVAVRSVEPIVAESDAPLSVRLETEHLIVVHKPAGQPTVPIRPGEPGTLAGALLGHYPELANVGHREREPGLLHRLDTQTSGLLIAARSTEVFVRLRRALSEGHIVKRYLAVVSSHGLRDFGVIERALVPFVGDPRRVALAELGAPNPRRTEWKKLRDGPRLSLVEVTAKKAYRHQVRVHLSSIGHPIAGDALYGGPAEPALGARHALHASYVAWTGDDLVPAFAVEDPEPEDFAVLVAT